MMMATRPRGSDRPSGLPDRAPPPPATPPAATELPGPPRTGRRAGARPRRLIGRGGLAFLAAMLAAAALWAIFIAMVTLVLWRHWSAHGP